MCTLPYPQPNTHIYLELFFPFYLLPTLSLCINTFPRCTPLSLYIYIYIYVFLNLWAEFKMCENASNSTHTHTHTHTHMSIYLSISWSFFFFSFYLCSRADFNLEFPRKSMNRLQIIDIDLNKKEKRLLFHNTFIDYSESWSRGISICVQTRFRWMRFFSFIRIFFFFFFFYKKVILSKKKKMPLDDSWSHFSTQTSYFPCQSDNTSRHAVWPAIDRQSLLFHLLLDFFFNKDLMI